MLRKLCNRNVLLGIIAVTGFALSGCGQTQPGPGGNAGNPAASAPQVVADASQGGWWCVEHGIPEDICARCSTSVAADFQKKGDWCKEHDRPESQCFICHPNLEEKFAAQYEAKYGKKPPKPEPEEEPKS